MELSLLCRKDVASCRALALPGRPLCCPRATGWRPGGGNHFSCCWKLAATVAGLPTPPSFLSHTPPIFSLLILCHFHYPDFSSPDLTEVWSSFPFLPPPTYSEISAPNTLFGSVKNILFAPEMSSIQIVCVGCQSQDGSISVQGGFGLRPCHLQCGSGGVGSSHPYPLCFLLASR